MSTAPVPEWDDDVMGVADAAGVNPAASIRTSYTEAEWAAVLVATWARQAAPPFTVDMSIDVDAPVDVDTPIDLAPTGYLDETSSIWVSCTHCDGTGLVEHRSWATGITHVITCPVCGGAS